MRCKKCKKKKKSPEFSYVGCSQLGLPTVVKCEGVFQASGVKASSVTHPRVRLIPFTAWLTRLDSMADGSARGHHDKRKKNDTALQPPLTFMSENQTKTMAWDLCTN